MDRTEMTTENVNVYIVTREGREYTDEALDYVKEMLCETAPGLTDSTFLFHMGRKLNDIDSLAHVLETGRDDSFVIVSMEKDIVLCNYGPGPDGIQSVIDVLHKSKTVQPGETSWTVLTTCIMERRQDPQA